jgi:predicted  nucleic acid-binding Zn-ribbon protein
LQTNDGNLSTSINNINTNIQHINDNLNQANDNISILQTNTNTLQTNSNNVTSIVNTIYSNNSLTIINSNPLSEPITFDTMVGNILLGYNNTFYTSIQSVIPSGYSLAGGRLDLCTAKSSKDSRQVPRITILSGAGGNGNVGIGTTNPSVNLDVIGNVRITKTLLVDNIVMGSTTLKNNGNNSTSFILPNNNGMMGHVLTTDGTGTTNWIDPGINKINNDISNLEAQATTTNSHLLITDNKINNIEDNIILLQNTTTSLNSNINTTIMNMSVVNTHLDTTDNQIIAIQSNIGKLNDYDNKLNSSINVLDNNITMLDSNINTIDNQIIQIH